ncbi:hypothetical protein CF326_g3715 [Tilletia indica]|nr:hypothetical protein CF326_g3715 [Tilletia indica]
MENSLPQRLVPLRVHRLQHLDPPAHHVFTSPAASAQAGISSYLPHWNAVPEKFFHPRHRNHHKSSPSTVTEDNTDFLDEPPTDLLRIGFQNPWPSFIRPSFWQIWHSLRWGVPPPHFEADIDDEFPHATHRERKQMRKRMRTDPELHLSVEAPDFEYEEGKVKATWVGHAGTLLTLPPAHGRTDPFRILFDPIFSNRCSPLRGAGPLRAYAPPCQVSDLPPIDLVIISHNHYDHLDYDTISDLWAANEQRGIRFIAPLGNKSWFVQEGLGIDPERVVDLDWWDELVLGGAPVMPVSAAAAVAGDAKKEEEKEEPKLHAEVQVPTTCVLEDQDKETDTQPPKPSTAAAAADLASSLQTELNPREQDALSEPQLPFIRVICTPAQHQSGRYAVDACSALWSSWVVEYHHSSPSEDESRKCFRTFFGGDTGYRFHDTVAAAERDAEAKARQQKRKEADRKERAAVEGGPLRKMSNKLGKRLSLSGSKASSVLSSSGSSSPAPPSVSAAGKTDNRILTDVPPTNGDSAKDADVVVDSPKEAVAVADIEDEEEEKKKKEAQPGAESEDPFPACPAFNHISTVLGLPNLLLLPISVGATISFLKSYDPLPPRWSPFPRVDERLTSAVHMGPEDAVRVFQLMTAEAAAPKPNTPNHHEHAPPASSHLRRFAHLEADTSSSGKGATALAIHWGTFVGGKDEVHQSIRALRRACGKEGVRFVREHRQGDEGTEEGGKNTFAVVNHGESVVVRL